MLGLPEGLGVILFIISSPMGNWLSGTAPIGGDALM